MKIFKSIAIVCIMLLSCIIVNPVQSAEINMNSIGTMFYVGGTGLGNYSSIQNAIIAASDGDTVFVYSGIYWGKISIGKSITLIGEDGENTIIDSVDYKDVVVINDENER